MTDTVKMAVERLNKWLEFAGDKPGQYVGTTSVANDDIRTVLAALEQAGEPEAVKECLTTEHARLGQEFDAWQDLVDKDDRTSPEEYPDMALITREELADYMQAAQSRGQAFDGEGEELAEAVRCIMARCEALEDEASNGIATTTANGRGEAHKAGFWRGQKSTAKSIREHLHDMTRAALSSAKCGEKG